MNNLRLRIDQTSNKAVLQQELPGKPRGISVVSRAGLIFVIMSLLLLAATGVSLWLSAAVRNMTQSMGSTANSGDLAVKITQLDRLQSLARSLSLGILVVGVLFVIISVWVARRRVLLPIIKLNKDFQKINQADLVADLPSITPLEQNDEIGEMSTTMSRMVDWLKESYATLEKQVVERTSGLQRRRVQIEVAAQIARDIASMRDLENLLFRSVNLIRDRFSFYHAGIFLNDQRG